MKNTDQVKAGKELSGESIESPRPAQEWFACGHPVYMRNRDDVHYCAEYPNGVHHSTDDEEDEEPELYACPWCMKDNQTTDQIRACSGFKSSRMPANETGHYYGYGCPDCRDEYRRLK